MSKRERRRWASRLEVLMLHLLKWRYQPLACPWTADQVLDDDFWPEEDEDDG